jgi:lipid II:glycine glycyltransferase (peptidoglycan interpeptide bridge formation enzyme)
MNRDEYVRKLKEQVDQWNAQMAKWEAMSEEVKNKYLQQLDEVQVRREEAMQELKRVQGASADAWTQMMSGADTAFKEMREAFERAAKALGKK